MKTTTLARQFLSSLKELKAANKDWYYDQSDIKKMKKFNKLGKKCLRLYREVVGYYHLKYPDFYRPDIDNAGIRYKQAIWSVF